MAKGILGSFFEVTPKDTITEMKKEQPKQVAPILINEPAVSVPLTSSGGYTGKFDQIFNSIIEKENLPGPDVAELLMSVKELQLGGLTEEQAYRSSFISLKSMGLTKDKLVETADYYYKIATQVRDDFNSEVIGIKEKDLNNTVNYQQELIKQMEELTAQLQEVNKKKNALTEEISNFKQEIEGSYNKASLFFNNVKLKIQNYL